jgi:hypothetical protein
MEVIDASDQIQRIEQVAKWLADKGIDPHNTRFWKARKVLSSGVITGELDEHNMLEFQWAFQELDDYYQLQKYLSHVDHQNFLDKLKRSIEGPHNNKDEGLAVAARNYMFELVIAAKFASQGIEIGFDGKPDVTLNLGSLTLFVECKQPSGQNPEELLKDAARQVRLRCAASEKEPSYGIIALGLTRYIAKISHLDRPLVTNGDDLSAEFSQTASRFDFSPITRRYPDTIGIITHLAIPFWRTDDMTPMLLRRVNFHALAPNDHPGLAKLKPYWNKA